MSSGMPPLDPVTLKSYCGADPAPQMPRTADDRVRRIAELLQTLDEAAAEVGLSEGRPPSEQEQRLVDSRLGVASSLFTALRYKHSATAHHCLRVAFGCSAWASLLEVPERYRVALETAALLHDVGKIGIADSVLLKPGNLSTEEAAQMARHRRMAVDILSSCCATPEVLEIVRYSTAWYDGSRHGLELKGDGIPFGARMLAIVDAFDAMITAHVYRPARSKERALKELFEFSGTQFDPKLVHSFSDFVNAKPQALERAVSDHWLTTIAGQQDRVEWGLFSPSRLGDDAEDVTDLFEARLIDNMHDGVMFVDSQLKIFFWNTGAERMTGMAAEAAKGRVWALSMLEARNKKGRTIPDSECPVTRTAASGAQSITRMVILGRQGREVTVDLHTIAVRSTSGATLGIIILLQDASPEASLEQRCQVLHDQATRDPLTQVANRAEFDRMQELFIQAHLESGLPCSLIITDVDHFKHVNDVYGHQAGDAVLKNYAALLSSACRSGDVVARYGGEEFVVLCADCNNAAAAHRADEIRRKLGEMPHAAIGNRSIEASFGVTELQPGDTPDTMLRRADRALLQAKDRGRNQVVQLGDGMGEKEKKRGWWPFKTTLQRCLIDCQLVTVVPIEVVAQKLRGFIADHSARITSTGEDHLHLEVSGESAGKFRRQGDRTIPFLIELKFEERRILRTNNHGIAAGDSLQTRVHVMIRPKKERDRRLDQAAERARHLLVSLKSYLMAKEEMLQNGSALPETAGVNVGEPELPAAITED